MKQASERTVRYDTSVSWPKWLTGTPLASLVMSTSKLLDRIAGLAVTAAMLLVVANVIMRTLFNKPILGALEYVSMLFAVAVGFSLALCAAHNGHIAIDLLVERLHPRVRLLVDAVIRLVTIIFLGACTWGLVLYARTTAASGLVSPTTQTPVHPFIGLVALGFFLFSLVQVLKLVQGLGKGGRGDE
ncbi:MAG TPA: TRAP transporter small permease [Clostridia bacterium]|nr:TRAP transporter small permease [Clostridia bacterium]